MATKLKYCLQCAKSTPHTYDKPDTKFHLIITIITCGMWFIPWMIIKIVSNLKGLFRTKETVCQVCQTHSD